MESSQVSLPESVHESVQAEPEIRVRELRKVFQADFGEVVAVDGISFDVFRGEVYGLLGPNGAGKTTTLRMILGLLQPDGGYCEVDGFRTNVDPFEVKRRIGFVSAAIGLYQWLTAREMLMFFADVYGVDEKEAAGNVAEIVEVFSLHEIIDRRCATLSTGQKQRINLARALIHKPPVILLDEPTLGLDVIGSQAVFQYIELLRKQEKAIIVSTHRLDEAQRLCDRFGLIFEGRIRNEGTLAQLQESTGQTDLVEMFLRILEERGPESTVSESERMAAAGSPPSGGDFVPDVTSEPGPAGERSGEDG